MHGSPRRAPEKTHLAGTGLSAGLSPRSGFRLTVLIQELVQGCRTVPEQAHLKISWRKRNARPLRSPPVCTGSSSESSCARYSRSTLGGSSHACLCVHTRDPQGPRGMQLNSSSLPHRNNFIGTGAAFGPLLLPAPSVQRTHQEPPIARPGSSPS